MLEHESFASTDLSALKGVCSGGALVPEQLVRTFERQLAAPFTIVFGQTECSPVATMTRPDDTMEDKSSTIGAPMPHVEVKIVDTETGATVPIGVVGELCTRGYHVMHNYFEMPEQTAEALDADGWLHTGDLAAMNDRGYCSIEGRLKDMIIRGGENIYPRELEELLFAHPSTRPSCSPTCVNTWPRKRRRGTGLSSTSSRSPGPARSKSSSSASCGKKAPSPSCSRAVGDPRR